MPSFTEPITVDLGLGDGDGDGEAEGDADADAWALADTAPAPLTPVPADADARAAATSTGAGDAMATTAAAVPAARTRYEAPIAVTINARLRRFAGTDGAAPAASAKTGRPAPALAVCPTSVGTPCAMSAVSAAAKSGSAPRSSGGCTAPCESSGLSGPFPSEWAGGMNELSPTPPLP